MAAALPADILEANRRAMKLLGEGQMHASHLLLTEALSQVEQMVKSIPPPTSTVARQTTAQQEVLLAYSVTLNNLGCQLRREDKLDEALRSIQKASDVEQALFGKPACSTMLNLSSVLVGMGRSAEALPIAKSCVLAAQGGEPTLLITALHNFAVALGQQTNKKEQRLALPTMLRALRESEEKLGDAHPTTEMLREKCGLTTPWIAAASAEETSDASPSSTGGHASPVKRPPPLNNTSTDTAVPPSSPKQQPRSARSIHGASSLRERGRKALATLNFGTPHSTPLVPADALVEPTFHAQDQLAAQRPPHTDLPPARAAPRNLPPLPEAPVPAAAKRNSSSAPTDTEWPPHASTDTLPVTALTVQQRPSVVLEHSFPTTHTLPVLRVEHRTSSVPLPASPVVPADAQVSTRRSESALSQALTPPTSAAASTRLPRYMRFAPEESALPAMVTAHGGAEVPLRLGRLHSSSQPPLSATTVVNRVEDDRPRLASGVSQTVPSLPTSALDTDVHKSVFHSSAAARRARETLRRHQQVEEEAFRQLRVRRAAEQEAEDRFREKLKVIESRRDARAATVIQKAWRHWWRLIGHPRHLLQQRQAEARRRRHAERLAMEAKRALPEGAGGRGEAANHRKSRHHHLSMGNDDGGRQAALRRAVPPCVVACAGTWLRRTECRRYLVRRKYAPLPRYIHEQEVSHAVRRLQARFRGRRVRRALAEHLEHPQARRQGHVVDSREEERAYAAMVIQRAYRSTLARRARYALHVARYEAPTRTIQSWWRRTLMDQRARRVDTRSVLQREAAAVRIQTAWRGHTARIECLMRRLRAGIEKSRALEARGRQCLQRVGRGCLARTRLGIRWQADSRRLLSAHGADERTAAADDQTRDSVVSAPPRFTALLIPRTAYEAECLDRAPAVAQEMAADRERYDVGMYAAPQAERERQAWVESLRLRPTQVALRRAGEDFRTECEAHTVLRDRAASKIQRLFRAWLRHYHNPRRDRDLLLRSRGLYQQRELELRFQRQQHAKEKARAVALLGSDCSAPARAYRETLQQELERLQAAQPVAVQAVRSGPERHYDEYNIQRDEKLVQATYPEDLARLREDMETRRTATGKVYVHPYYKPYPSDEYRLTLGID